VFVQNHDQVGNRREGDRLCHNITFEAQKLAAGAVLFAPFLPLLFMGEEYAEDAPFLYFVDHGDPDLIAAVRRGRAEEFAKYNWGGVPPDPADAKTFERSRLDLNLREKGKHRTLLHFYKELLRLRKAIPALCSLNKEQQEVTPFELERALLVLRIWEDDFAATVFNFGEKPVSLALSLEKGQWDIVLDSSDKKWDGPGTPMQSSINCNGRCDVKLNPTSFVLLTRETRD